MYVCVCVSRGVCVVLVCVSRGVCTCVFVGG